MPADLDAEQPTWAWIGQVVRQRRESLGLRQPDVRVRSGGGDNPRVSVQNLSKLETGRATGLKKRTRDGLAVALRWPNDFIDRLLDGADPVDLEGVNYELVGDPVDTARALLERQTARENWWGTHTGGGPPSDIVTQERTRILTEAIMKHDEVLTRLTEQVQALAEQVAALAEQPDTQPGPSASARQRPVP